LGGRGRIGKVSCGRRADLRGNRAFTPESANPSGFSAATTLVAFKMFVATAVRAKCARAGQQQGRGAAPSAGVVARRSPSSSSKQAGAPLRTASSVGPARSRGPSASVQPQRASVQRSSANAGANAASGTSTATAGIQLFHRNQAVQRSATTKQKHTAATTMQSLVEDVKREYATVHATGRALQEGLQSKMAHLELVRGQVEDQMKQNGSAQSTASNAEKNLAELQDFFNQLNERLNQVHRLVPRIDSQLLARKAAALRAGLVLGAAGAMASKSDEFLRRAREEVVAHHVQIYEEAHMGCCDMEGRMIRAQETASTVEAELGATKSQLIEAKGRGAQHQEAVKMAVQVKCSKQHEIEGAITTLRASEQHNEELLDRARKTKLQLEDSQGSLAQAEKALEEALRRENDVDHQFQSLLAARRKIDDELQCVEHQAQTSLSKAESVFEAKDGFQKSQQDCKDEIERLRVRLADASNRGNVAQDKKRALQSELEGDGMQAVDIASRRLRLEEKLEHMKGDSHTLMDELSTVKDRTAALAQSWEQHCRELETFRGQHEMEMEMIKAKLGAKQTSTSQIRARLATQRSQLEEAKRATKDAMDEEHRSSMDLQAGGDTDPDAKRREWADKMEEARNSLQSLRVQLARVHEMLEVENAQLLIEVQAAASPSPACLCPQRIDEAGKVALLRNSSLSEASRSSIINGDPSLHEMMKNLEPLKSGVERWPSMMENYDRACSSTLAENRQNLCMAQAKLAELQHQKDVLELQLRESESLRTQILAQSAEVAAREAVARRASQSGSYSSPLQGPSCIAPYSILSNDNLDDKLCPGELELCGSDDTSFDVDHEPPKTFRKRHGMVSDDLVKGGLFSSKSNKGGAVYSASSATPSYRAPYHPGGENPPPSSPLKNRSHRKGKKRSSRGDGREQAANQSTAEGDESCAGPLVTSSSSRSKKSKQRHRSASHIERVPPRALSNSGRRSQANPKPARRSNAGSWCDDDLKFRFG
jgi:predicted  nucleic acid-binding Zn-ribbon protein